MSELESMICDNIDNNLLLLDQEQRRNVLKIYNVSSCSMDKYLSDEGYSEFINKYRPKIINPDNVGPQFVHTIICLSKWRKVMDIYVDHGIPFMPEDNYNEYLTNVVTCASRIQKTLMFRIKGKRVLEDLLLRKVVSKLDDKHSGCQKICFDLQMWKMIIFIVVLISLLIQFGLAGKSYVENRWSNNHHVTDSIHSPAYFDNEVMIDHMWHAGCGQYYEYYQYNNYRISNNMIINYPNMSDALKDMCANMSDFAIRSANNYTNKFYPLYDLGNTDLDYFRYFTCSDMYKNLSRYCYNTSEYIVVTPLNSFFDWGLKFPHKYVSINYLNLNIPKNQTNHSSHFYSFISIYDKECYLNFMESNKGHRYIDFLLNMLEGNITINSVLSTVLLLTPLTIILIICFL